MAKSGRDRAARELFMKEALAVLKADERVEHIVPNLDEFLVEIGPEDAKHKIYLRNFFDELRELAPAERQARLRAKLSTLLDDSDEPSGWGAAREQIYSVVRLPSYVTAAGEAGSKMLLRPLAPFLGMGAVIDYPSKMVSVMQDELPAWKVDADAVFAQGGENLCRLRSSLGRYGESEGIHHLLDEDSYEAARLTSPSFMRALARNLEPRGRLVVAVPHRSLFLVTDDADDARILRLAEIARREHDASPRCLSPALYTIDDGGRCLAYTRAGKDSVANAVGLGHRLLARSEYGAQKTVLDAEHEAKELDRFVATYNLMSSKTSGAAWSYAVWTNVPSWLPYTDYVLFNPGDRNDMFFVRWDAVEQLAGKLWNELPLLLAPRVEARTYPSTELLAKLRALAVDPQ
jgi:hypothetical protein